MSWRPVYRCFQCGLLYGESRVPGEPYLELRTCRICGGQLEHTDYVVE